MVTVAPVIPEVGDTLEIVGLAVTVKLTPFDAWPDTVTTTLPVVVVGTVHDREAAVQLEHVAVALSNITVLEPCDDPNVVPLIVTLVPTGPLVGESDVMCGVTVNETPLLAFPPTITTTLPVAAPEGTVHVILVALQVVTEQATPLNVTFEVP
jgi:hypothetical protein